ncbi:hypothetical protein [Limobrevibacterium gyesilva]|uniref:Lipoprotein n=1 Tax=Limobrevibacterium gyesilva TaxID=2991712 RepID=A0AA41YIM6_9PROT|nr:hypothetical protein [Limobrevibacterium gyesilva]MCW3474276.1 hypothetical protein [Limobrevibacterium gyesilva]
MSPIRLIASWGLIAILAACQQQPSAAPPVAADPPVLESLAQPPSCAAGVSAALEDGAVVQFRGGDPRDPDVCLIAWSGRSYRYFLGFWGDGRFGEGTAEERDAIRRVLTGPPGTEASFALTRAKLWGKVTVTHVANPILTVGSRRVATMEIRAVWHDSQGREDVRNEKRIWIDQATGIVVQRQTVTPMANGGVVTNTTWRVVSMQPAG